MCGAAFFFSRPETIILKQWGLRVNGSDVPVFRSCMEWNPHPYPRLARGYIFTHANPHSHSYLEFLPRRGHSKGDICTGSRPENQIYHQTATTPEPQKTQRTTWQWPSYNRNHRHWRHIAYSAAARQDFKPPIHLSDEDFAVITNNGSMLNEHGQVALQNRKRAELALCRWRYSRFQVYRSISKTHAIFFGIMFLII